MGIFNSFGAMSGQFAAKQERAQIAGALAAELQVPGRLKAILRAIQNNGFTELLGQWTEGQTAPIAAGELPQSLAGTGLMESLAKRTSMPTGVVKGSLAQLLPLAVHYLSGTGQILPGFLTLEDSTFSLAAFLQAVK